MTEEELSLVRNDAEGRYEAYLDGHRVSLASFYQRGEVVVLPHTETDPAFGGRGYAGRLVQFALNDIRGRGHRVEPACWFVAHYIRDNPEYADLVG
ncbi:MAG: GNAT family N-acetyltransferase [Jatrophihabitantaceae bacterium]